MQHTSEADQSTNLGNDMTHDEMLKASLELETGTHGSFAALIGEAYLKADGSNAERLSKAFPELFERGLSFAKSKG